MIDLMSSPENSDKHTPVPETESETADPGERPGLEAENAPRRGASARTATQPPSNVTVVSLVIWGAVVLGAGIGLGANGIPFWWLSLIFGVAVPLALVVQRERALKPREIHANSAPRDKEREVLGALLARGVPTTPVMVALATSLTVEEAARILAKLGRKDHLKVYTQDGVLAYELPAASKAAERELAVRRAERHELPRGHSASVDQAPEDNESLRPLDEDLSEREVEVLVLLASGRTNSEIAADLFVAVGTVKAHISNIYGKLGARNRAEAISRARTLKLLP